MTRPTGGRRAGDQQVVPYLVAIVVMAILGTVTVAILALIRTDTGKDNALVIATIVSFIAPTSAALVSILYQIAKLHGSIRERDEWARADDARRRRERPHDTPPT